jgi:hypothetical protein
VLAAHNLFTPLQKLIYYLVDNPASAATSSQFAPASNYFLPYLAARTLSPRKILVFPYPLRPQSAASRSAHERTSDKQFSVVELTAGFYFLQVPGKVYKFVKQDEQPDLLH